MNHLIMMAEAKTVGRRRDTR